MHTLTSGTKKLVLRGKTGKTAIMAVLNITPDSFSDGGRYYRNIEAAVVRAEMMVREKADIIDVGGESTRPGSDGISADEEIARVVPVIAVLRAKLSPDVWISVDTNKAEVAEEALKAGADMVNALGGIGSDPKLADVVKKHGCPIAIYHIRGTPKTMQDGEIKYDDIVAEIKDFFVKEIQKCERAGVARAQIVLDPGIGFGKTVEQNVEIIRRLGEFSALGCPMLVGISRKSHLGAILQSELGLHDIPPPLERVEASLAETAVAVANGAHIVRTHDVGVTKKFLATLNYIQNHG